MRLIDVSNVQGHIDWALVAKANVHGAWIKSTEGRTFNDPDFATNRHAAAKAGIHVGPYHFARPDNNSPISEAKHFVSVVRKLGLSELKPVLDYEVSTRMTPSEHLAWIRTFNKVVEADLGAWPVFYSYPAMIDHLGLKVPVGGGLWLASYGVNDGLEHPIVVPKPWHRVVAHQFTSNGHIPGVPGKVDISDAASLNALLAHPVRGLLAAPVMGGKRLMV